MSLRVSLCSLMIGLSIAGCGSDAPRAADEREADERTADTAAGDSSIAITTDSGVVLRLADGQRVVLRDDTTAGARFRAHEHFGLVDALQAHLIEVSYYEGSSWLLIHHRTGDTTRVAGPPVVSPAGDRFAVASVDLIAGYSPNVLQVYRIRGERFVMEYEVDPDTWGPSDLRWITDDTLVFQQNVLDEEMEYEQHPARLVRSGTEWALELDRSSPDG